MADVDLEKQVSIIEKSIDVFKTGPGILRKNQDRSAKAVEVGKAIIAQWDAASLIEDAEERMKALTAADERSNYFLVNCAKVKTEEFDVRSALTQLMTSYAKLFTSAENDLDKTKAGSVPYQVQTYRNIQAAFVAREQKRKEQEAADKAAKVQARIEYKSSITWAIVDSLNVFLAERKVKYLASFNEITLDTIEERSLALANLNCVFPKEKLGEIVNIDVKPHSSLTEDEMEEIKVGANIEFDHDEFYKFYEDNISDLKSSLIDRMPSKKAELEELKKQADEAAEKEKKIQAAKGKQLAALKLQQQIDDKKRAEKEQEIKDRENAESLKLKQEADQTQKNSQLEINLKTEGAKTLSMFDQVAEGASVESKSQVRTGYEIKIHHPAAFAQIFQFYFDKEGKMLSIPELGRKTLDQMKRFCEQEALRTGTMIAGTTLLEYISTYKAIAKANK